MWISFRVKIGGTKMAKFTREEIEILRQSPYVRRVWPKAVSFTGDFKRRFWEMYTKKDLMPREILELLGIDAEILGAARIRNIAYNLKLEYAHFGEFSDIRRNAMQKEKIPPDQELKRLRLEVEYLRQEQEFIKKIMSACKEKKSK
jgi:hypothetical protein